MDFLESLYHKLLNTNISTTGYHNIRIIIVYYNDNLDLRTQAIVAKINIAIIGHHHFCLAVYKGHHKIVVTRL